MAQTIQIVPKYTFPNVETIVNNKSIVDPDTDVVTDRTAEALPYIAVFAGPKGIDNKLTRITSLPSYYNTFGQSNYKLYGQAGMMPTAILGNGANTAVWCMRVMPEDATYANAILSMWYKVVEEKVTGSEDTVKKLKVKFTSKSLELPRFNGDAKDDSAVNAYNEKFKAATAMLSSIKAIEENGSQYDGVVEDGGKYVDKDGYTQIPLAVFTSSGRGKYGNNYRWRISLNNSYEKEYGIKLYSFEIIDVENGATTVAKYVGGLTVTSKINGSSFINDVIDDTDENVPVNVTVFENAIEELFDVYKAVVTENATKTGETLVDPDDLDIDKFDPFFGCEVTTSRLKNGPAIPYYEVVDDVEDAIVVSDVVGNDILGGFDGSLSATQWEGSPEGAVARDIEEIKTVLENLYIAAFSGSIDKLILSCKRIPSVALFDAAYPMSVKKTLAQLALYRNDSILYLDCKDGDSDELETLTTDDINALETDFTEIELLNEKFNPFANYLISYNLDHYKIREASSGRRVDVSITYFLASIHAAHINTYGNHIPMVGEYAQLTGHVRNSLMPAIESHEADLKEKLNELRFNYFEATGENIFRRSTQNTSVVEDSDLLEESNVQVLMELKRNIEADAADNHYKFTSTTDRANFKEYIQSKYDYLIGTKVQSLSIDYDMSEWEFDHSVVHVYIAVTFRQLTKRTLVEIDVNKRVYDAEA